MAISGRPTVSDQLSALRLIINLVGVRDGFASALASAGSVDAVFVHLESATSARERASRQQAGPAILLYRALRQRVGQTRALNVLQEVVAQGALRFLGRQLHDLDPTSFDSWSDEERQRRADAWLDRFFTAEAELTAVTNERVEFQVTGCALHRLAVGCGHPELAPLFCSADAAFFRARGIDLAVPSRIAEGDSRCHFVLRLATDD